MPVLSIAITNFYPPCLLVCIYRESEILEMYIAVCRAHVFGGYMFDCWGMLWWHCECLVYCPRHMWTEFPMWIAEGLKGIHGKLRDFWEMSHHKFGRQSWNDVILDSWICVNISDIKGNIQYCQPWNCSRRRALGVVSWQELQVACRSRSVIWEVMSCQSTLIPRRRACGV